MTNQGEVAMNDKALDAFHDAYLELGSLGERVLGEYSISAIFSSCFLKLYANHIV